jgi:hypothetical protein
VGLSLLAGELRALDVEGLHLERPQLYHEEEIE